MVRLLHVGGASCWTAALEKDKRQGRSRRSQGTVRSQKTHQNDAVRVPKFPEPPKGFDVFSKTGLCYADQAVSVFDEEARYT